jgi:uncharacterized membrane protein YhhN
VTITLLLAAITIAAVLLLLRAIRDSSPLQRLYKMIAATGFVSVAVEVGATDSDFGRVMLVGFVLSWIGDLMLTYHSSQAFIGGLGAFLLAHVAFAVAFSVRGLDSSGPVVIVAIAVASAAIVVIRRLVPFVGSSLRAPVLAYIVAISAMVLLAFASAASEADWRLPAGALAFYLSDLAVARDRFVAGGPVNRYWGLPLYFGAQLLLAWASGG